MTKRPRIEHNDGVVHVRQNGRNYKSVVKGPPAYNARGSRSSAGSNRSNKALGNWLPEKRLVHVTAMKGNFWRISGFTSEQQDYLYPEEALYLCEKKQLIVHLNQDVVCETPDLYSLVMQDLSLPCYQAYIRLKVSVI